ALIRWRDSHHVRDECLAPKKADRFGSPPLPPVIAKNASKLRDIADTMSGVVDSGRQNPSIALEGSATAIADRAHVPTASDSTPGEPPERSVTSPVLQPQCFGPGKVTRFASGSCI